MANTLSLRRLWLMYKRLAVTHRPDRTKRGLAIAHSAFYAGGCGVLKVLAHLLERGDYEELHETIRRQGRQIEKILRRRPRRH